MQETKQKKISLPSGRYWVRTRQTFATINHDKVRLNHPNLIGDLYTEEMIHVPIKGFENRVQELVSSKELSGKAVKDFSSVSHGKWYVRTGIEEEESDE